MATTNTADVPSYDINQHRHLFAAWAASRGASVSSVCRFKVEVGRDILERSGFNADLCHPELLPCPDDMDSQHRQWRLTVIQSAKDHDLPFSNGIAAKLINLYLKGRFVCGGWHDHPNVAALHPPIDSIMLDALIEENVGGLRKEWQRLEQAKWSKFTSEQYEHAIALVRQCLVDQPLSIATTSSIPSWRLPTPMLPKTTYWHGSRTG